MTNRYIDKIYAQVSHTRLKGNTLKAYFRKPYSSTPFELDTQDLVHARGVFSPITDIDIPEDMDISKITPNESVDGKQYLSFSTEDYSTDGYSVNKDSSYKLLQGEESEIKGLDISAEERLHVYASEWNKRLDDGEFDQEIAHIHKVADRYLNPSVDRGNPETDRRTLAYVQNQILEASGVKDTELYDDYRISEEPFNPVEARNAQAELLNAETNLNPRTHKLHDIVNAEANDPNDQMNRFSRHLDDTFPQTSYEDRQKVIDLANAVAFETSTQEKQVNPMDLVDEAYTNAINIKPETQIKKRMVNEAPKNDMYPNRLAEVRGIESTAAVLTESELDDIGKATLNDAVISEHYMEQEFGRDMNPTPTPEELDEMEEYFDM